jgi:hypothetical protein
MEICPECRTEMDDTETICSKCGHDSATAAAPGLPGQLITCSSCKSAMHSLGELSLRVGGKSGSWQLLLGHWAELDEGLLPLAVYRCSHRKRVEFFDFQNRLSLKGQPE